MKMEFIIKNKKGVHYKVMKKCFCTSKAAIPAKTVSQAVIGNGMIFVSG